MESSAEEKDSGVMNAVDQFPFMLHVLVVLVITYLFLSFTSNGLFYFCFFIVYLFEVERRGRARERCRIASEERRKINTRRTFDEGETLRWLNEGIKSMWPVCMEKFASKYFFGPMVPRFLNIYKPWFVNEVKIDSLHLGSTPPVFNFIRALEHPPEGDHLVYESTMEFNSSDDMNAKMSVQTIRRLGGFWTTFYISRLHVEGTVRISVKFLKGWPVVKRVRLCFASKPQVTMSYRPMDKNGIDVSLIPVFANVVEKMVDNAMELSIVQPHLLVVDIEKLVSTMFSDSETQVATGIFKVENKSTLVVEILEATNLKAADSNGLSDPFVDITFGQHQKKTKVKKKTLNPKWENEQHEFPIVNWDMSNLLTLRVRDWDRVPTIGSSHELGICTVPVNEYRNGERRELNLPLEKVSKGHLRFAITVNYTQRPQVAEEPLTNSSGRETVTQEIQTSSSAVNYTSLDKAPEITRSKSETNLERLRIPPNLEGYKHRSQNSTGEPAALEAFQEHTSIGESHDIIEMPYGPPGAFTIFHPGLLSPLRFPPSKKEIEPQVTKSSSELDNGGAETKQRRLRYFQRRKRRNSGKVTSQENIQVDTMSEGDSSSVDFSAELMNFKPEPYHGPVKMNLDCPGTTKMASAMGEPPWMDQQLATLSVSSSHLEPILSGKTPTTPAINMYFGNALDVETAAAGPGEIDLRASVVSGTSKVGSSSGSSRGTGVEEKSKGEKAELLPSSSHPQRLRSSPKRQTPTKPIFSLPTTWYKKMTLLTKRAKRKKQLHDTSEVVYSSELKYPSGYYAESDRPLPTFYHEDSDTSMPSGPQTFLLESPLDTKRIYSRSHAGTSGHAPGDSPEQRKIINSRSHGANSGSQSDRHWASKMKKLIPDQFRTSQSFRHESLDLKRLQTPIQDSSLQSIPERSGGHRNGKVHD